MLNTGTVATTEIKDLPLINRGKVRDVYRLDDERLLFVATDRISAFDCVMPNQIPSKGHVLTAISVFWFERLCHIIDSHFVTVSLENTAVADREELKGRSMIVRNADVFPVECVVRGYLEGSGWKDYQSTGRVCGYELPAGLKQCERLPAPLFTPATKAASGHDENISFERFTSIVGVERGKQLREVSLALYEEAGRHAFEKGIILADTKFEFGVNTDGEMMLIDEALTPDSSRFWEADKYQPGRAQQSFDKQFVREYLESLDWDKAPPAPELPIDIVNATTERYLEAYKRLTGKELSR